MKKILYCTVVALMVATMSCKKEQNLPPAGTPPAPISTDAKTPKSAIEEISFTTGKKESDIPKDLDGQIIYGTSLSSIDDSWGLPTGSNIAYDYFLAGFNDANGNLYNIGAVTVNDTLIAYDTKDSTYRKVGPTYFPGFPGWPTTIPNGGMGFEKSANLKIENSIDLLPPLPMSSASDKVIIPQFSKRYTDITVSIEGNIVDADTIIYYIADTANLNYKRYYFPVTKKSYTFTAAQINTIIPANADKCLIGIYVAKFATRRLSNGKKVMIVGLNAKASTVNFTKI